MSTAKQSPSISDKELSQVLASLREDIAAPPDFRAKLMQRLQAEGLVSAGPKIVVARASWWERLQSSWSPVRLGWAASAGLVLILTLRFVPQTKSVMADNKNSVPSKVAERAGIAALGEAPLAKPRHSTSVEVAFAPKSHVEAAPVELMLPKSESSKNAALGNEASSAPVTTSQVSGAAPMAAASMPATGAGQPLPSRNSLSAASVGVDPKPTIVVVSPTPTALVNPLDGNSQLRGNVIRASQGEAAVLLYRVLKPGHVHIEIFDRLGRSIVVLKDADQAVGIYELKWGGHSDNGSMAASGIMVLALQAPGYFVQHKLVLVK